MRTYLLDTNIISYLADPSSASHNDILEATKSLPDENRLTISLLTLYELAYGYVRAPGHSRLLAIVREEGIGVLLPSEAGADVFARLKEAYQRVEEIRLQSSGSGTRATTSIAVSVPAATVRTTSTASSAVVRASMRAEAPARNSRGVPAPTSKRMIRPRL
jgi:predicted nucleic acid-binding protein